MMKTFKQYLNEHSEVLSESLSADKIAQDIRLYGIVFGKQFEGTFKPLFIEDYTKSEEDKGSGYRLINNQGYQLRFNYNLKDVKAMGQNPDNPLVVQSIDYWDKGNHQIDKPSLTVTFKTPLNVLQIWKRLESLLKRRKVGEYNVINLLDPSLNEGTEVKDIRNSTLAQRQRFVKSTGASIKIFSTKDGSVDGVFDQELDKAGLKDTWDQYFVTIKTGKKEQNTVSGILRETSEEYKNLKSVESSACTQDLKDTLVYFKQSTTKVLNLIQAREDENSVVFNLKDTLTSCTFVEDFTQAQDLLVPGKVVVLKTNKLQDEDLAVLKSYKDQLFKLVLISTKPLEGLDEPQFFNYTQCKKDNYYRVLEVLSRRFPKYSLECIKQFLDSEMQFSKVENTNIYCSEELRQPRKELDIYTCVLGMYFYTAFLENSEYLASLFS